MERQVKPALGLTYFDPMASARFREAGEPGPPRAKKRTKARRGNSLIFPEGNVIFLLAQSR